MARLSNHEKAKIQRLLQEDVTIRDIAHAINRRPDTVEKYVDELLNILKTVEHSRNQANFEKKKHKYVSNEDYDEALKLLRNHRDNNNNKLSEKDATARLELVIKNHLVGRVNAEELYKTALTIKGGGEFLGRTTAGGQSGVVVMSNAASAAHDEVKKKNVIRNAHKGRGIVWKIKEQELE